MSYQSSTLVSCPNLQFELGTFYQDKLRREQLRFLEYIVSPENMNGLNQQVNPGRGKTRTVELTYRPRLSESSVTETTGRPCASADKIGDNVEIYEIDTTATLNSGERIAIADLAKICKDNERYIVDVIATHAEVMDRKIASQIGTQAAALAGKWSTDTAAAYTVTNDRLIVTTKTSGQFVPGAVETIRAATEMSGFGSQIIAFGGSLLRENFALSLAGCCADSGLDAYELMLQYGFAYGYDSRLATGLGSITTRSLVMAPQALQLLHYTEAEGHPDLMFDGNYSINRIVSPAGVPMDLVIKNDCGVIDINLYSCTKLVALPATMFLNDDKFLGVNFVAEINVTNT